MGKLEKKKKLYFELMKCDDYLSIDYLSEILYLICDYPHKHYTFKHFEV